MAIHTAVLISLTGANDAGLRPFFHRPTGAMRAGFWDELKTNLRPGLYCSLKKGLHYARVISHETA